MTARRPHPATESARRLLDVVVAATALAVCAIPIALIAIVLKVSDPRAPVLFHQRRCGRHGRPFRIHKFRTMGVDAEARKAELRDRSSVGWPDFRVRDDPRVTRVGRWLRRTSLDELPQFVNVVRGDMAIVGPRPTSFLRDTYAPWQTERLETTPGLTGPWQVLGRDSMDFEERCRLEIAYFRQRSLCRDAVLVAATARSVLRRTAGA